MSFSPRRQQELMNDPGLTILPPGPAWGSFAVSFVLLAVLVFAFIYRASTLINESRSRETSAVPVMSTEEKHRVNLALNARAGQQGEAEAGVMDRFIRWLPCRTDGETGALWPWVISRFAAGDHPFQENAVMEEDPSLLRRGLWIHVWIVGILLTLLSLVAASSLSPPAAVLMLLPAAFLVLLPRAVVFGPDLLYYLLFFLAWLCALRLLRKNSVWLHGIFGVVAGFAWLADTSGWIVVAAWFLAASCRWLREVLRRGHGLPDESWTCRNHFVGLVALVIGWVAVCSPRCGASMDRWGSPFFSWQQQWMWMDSTDRNALREWAKAHPGKNELDALPENERPSPANYLRTHSPEQIRDRMAKG
ncbi:MAG TPA: hypothetical protein VHM91_11935, partial [Verrucomicrobiales bacterium]|nr:hypothetical protein [Verrucomicrobiales bacterium]